MNALNASRPARPPAAYDARRRGNGSLTDAMNSAAVDDLIARLNAESAALASAHGPAAGEDDDRTDRSGPEWDDGEVRWTTTERPVELPPGAGDDVPGHDPAATVDTGLPDDDDGAARMKRAARSVADATAAARAATMGAVGCPVVSEAEGVPFAAAR